MVEYNKGKKWGQVRLRSFHFQAWLAPMNEVTLRGMNLVFKVVDEHDVEGGNEKEKNHRKM